MDSFRGTVFRLVMFVEFEKSADSDYPITLLQKAGVDLSTPKPIVEALKVFEESLDMLEAVII